MPQPLQLPLVFLHCIWAHCSSCIDGHTSIMSRRRFCSSCVRLQSLTVHGSHSEVPLFRPIVKSSNETILIRTKDRVSFRCEFNFGRWLNKYECFIDSGTCSSSEAKQTQCDVLCSQRHKKPSNSTYWPLCCMWQTHIPFRCWGLLWRGCHVDWNKPHHQQRWVWEPRVNTNKAIMQPLAKKSPA